MIAIIPESDLVVQAKEKKLKQFWLLYRYIKSKINKPNFTKTCRERVNCVFDKLCHPLQMKSRLDKPLRQLQRLKNDLLICIEQTEVPLHNNQSESDIREFVIRRIVSGATKSHEGLLCRDTFTSLKKQRRGIKYHSGNY